MTNKEAIKRIKFHKVIHKMDEPRAIYISEALDMAIDALERKFRGNAVNRQDVIDAIVAWTVEDRPDIEMPTDLVDRVNALPSTERKGKWIDKWHILFKEELPMCSVCNNFSIFKSDFCPNCGADMRERREE